MGKLDAERIFRRPHSFERPLSIWLDLSRPLAAKCTPKSDALRFVDEAGPVDTAGRFRLMLHRSARLWTAFREHHALQRGFCIPGILTTAPALLTEEPDTEADRIHFTLSGNLCHCTGYILNVAAVLGARCACRKADKP